MAIWLFFQNVLKKKQQKLVLFFSHNQKNYRSFVTPRYPCSTLLLPPTQWQPMPHRGTMPRRGSRCHAVAIRPSIIFSTSSATIDDNDNDDLALNNNHDGDIPPLLFFRCFLTHHVCKRGYATRQSRSSVHYSSGRSGDKGHTIPT
jgi:hypothetical protein